MTPYTGCEGLNFSRQFPQLIEPLRMTVPMILMKCALISPKEVQKSRDGAHLDAVLIKPYQGVISTKRVSGPAIMTNKLTTDEVPVYCLFNRWMICTARC